VPSIEDDWPDEIGQCNPLLKRQLFGSLNRCANFFRGTRPIMLLPFEQLAKLFATLAKSATDQRFEQLAIMVG
jgi:hypothetical protein